MNSATIGNDNARVLSCVRRLLWSAILAFVTMDAAVTLAGPAAPEPLSLEQPAAHFGVTCGCSYNPETI